MATEEKQLIEKGSVGMAHAKEIQFEHFWAEHGARIAFTLDGVEAMMSASHDAKEPLFFHVRDMLYKIPWHSIDNYFKTHTKPKPPMTQKEELEYWKNRAMKLEAQAKGIQGKVSEPPAEDFKVAGPDEAPETEKIVPPQDKGIPVPTKEEREKDRQTLSEVQEEIKADLKKDKKKGVSNRDEKYLKAVPKEIPKAEEAL